MSWVVLQKSLASFQFMPVSALKRRQPRPTEVPSVQPGGQSTSSAEARSEKKRARTRI